MWLHSDNLEILKKEIEELRNELNNFMKYPDIFKDEIMKCSEEINEKINEYMKHKKNYFTKT